MLLRSQISLQSWILGDATWYLKSLVCTQNCLTEAHIEIDCIGYLLGVGTLIAESILVMRTWVIWNRSRYIGSALIIGLILCWIPIFYFLAQSLNSLVCKSMHIYRCQIWF